MGGTPDVAARRRLNTPETTPPSIPTNSTTGPIAAWLSGYYNAKRNNRVIDLQTLEENMSNVTNYCSDGKNFKVPVMKAVEQVLGKSN